MRSARLYSVRIFSVISIMELQQITEPGSGSPAQQTPGAHPPAPSPLSGCYLLIVIGEPHSPEHKEIILQRIAKGRTTNCSVVYMDVCVRRVEQLTERKARQMRQWLFHGTISYFDYMLSASVFCFVIICSVLQIGLSEPSLMTLLIH